MSRNSYQEALYWAAASGTAIASTTTETIIFPDYTVPANFMVAERLLRIRAIGQYSTTGTPTLIFAVRWGGVAGTVLCKTAACTTPSGVTAAMWDFDVLIQTRSSGATGTVMANGVARVHAAVAGTVASTTGAGLVTPMTAGGVVTPATATIDTTSAALLSVTAKWSASDPANTLTGLNLLVESLN